MIKEVLNMTYLVMTCLKMSEMLSDNIGGSDRDAEQKLGNKRTKEKNKCTSQSKQIFESRTKHIDCCIFR